MYKATFAFTAAIGRAIRAVAHRMTDRELHLNQAQLRVIPVPIETTPGATRRRTR